MRVLSRTAGILALWIAIYASVAYGDSVDRRYEKAAKGYHLLFGSTDYGEREDNWRKVIRQFQSIYKHSPNHRKAAASLYNVGKLYRGLFRKDAKSIYLDRSNIAFRTLVQKYPNSALSDNAQFLLAENYEIFMKDANLAIFEYQKLVRLFPKRSMAKRAAEKLSKLRPDVKSVETPPLENALPPSELKEEKFGGPDVKESGSGGRLLLISKVDYWSTEEWSRMVVNVDAGTRYRYRALPSDEKQKKGQRIVLDILNAYIPPHLKKRIATRDGLVKQAGIEQFDRRTVRVVLDLTSLKRVKVFDFALPNQFKIVVDILGSSVMKSRIGNKTAVPPSVATRRSSQKPLTLTESLGLKVRRIILDPGHGGKDPGAIAFGVKEKDIALKIAKRLKRIIAREAPDVEVYLTRTEDVYMELEARTAFANEKRGDLFISIHVNASEEEQVWGLETYTLNLTTDNDALALAAKENRTTIKNISALQSILNELMKDAKIHESGLLAKYIQESAIDAVRATKMIHLKDLGVKKAPFIVLMGAQMPSVMIEVGFLTNRTEHRLLKSSKYQFALARGIFNGISTYIN